jgi:DNA polymerase III epsilon subunit-like protein
VAAPPYDPLRCSLHYLQETLAVAEADLRVVCDRFGFPVRDGHLANEDAVVVREYLDAHCARSVPEWFVPRRRRAEGDVLGLGAPHDT